MKSAIAFACFAAASVLTSCVPAPVPGAQPPVQRERIAYLRQTAGEPITCKIGTDCNEKWARALTWVAQHSSYTIEKSTEAEIKTTGPVDPTTDSAFTITQSLQDAGTHSITFASSCGAARFCSPTALELSSGFHNYVMYGN